MEIEGIRIDDTVDITDKVCPLTFVKAKVAIDELEDGEVIAIRMNDGEPVQNVPRSIKEEGHQILKLVNNEDGTYNLIVKKVEDETSGREKEMAERVTKDTFEEKVLKSSLPVLIDFYSDSCVPCKKMSPVIGAIADEQTEKLNVYKVNTNFDSELAEKYSVMSVPTIVLFKDGEEIARKSGAEKKVVLEEWITQSLDK